MVKKIEIIKKQIEKEEKKKKEEEKKMNEIKVKNEKKRKEQENKYKVSIIGEKWIKLSEYNYDSVEKNKILKEFDKNAIETCLSNNKKKFNVIQKKIETVPTNFKRWSWFQRNDCQANEKKKAYRQVIHN